MTKTHHIESLASPQNNGTLNLKPIVFKKLLLSGSSNINELQFRGTHVEPKDYDHIVLIENCYKHHVMVAWKNSTPERKDVFLGDWGDGVVE